MRKFENKRTINFRNYCRTRKCDTTPQLVTISSILALSVSTDMLRLWPALKHFWMTNTDTTNVCCWAWGVTHSTDSSVLIIGTSQKASARLIFSECHARFSFLCGPGLFLLFELGWVHFKYDIIFQCTWTFTTHICPGKIPYKIAKECNQGFKKKKWCLIWKCWNENWDFL